MDKKTYLKQWREANKQKRRDYAKQYNDENRERLAEQKRAYYLANREAFIERAKRQHDADPKAATERANEWNRNNPERRKEILRAWSQRHPESVNKNCAMHRERHPDYHKRRLAEWRKRNPLLARQYSQKRRARILGAGGEITAEEVASLYEKQKGKCSSCKKELNMQYQLDHVMPLSLGGKHEIANAQILCRKCNQMKHAMHPDDWAARIGKLFV